MTAIALAALLALGLVAGCDVPEPGTPPPFSSPGVTIDAPPVPPTTLAP